MKTSLMKGSIRSMNSWQKESLGLKFGDRLIWEDAEIATEEGPPLVSAGIRGKVTSLHDGFHFDVTGEVIRPGAMVQFENGMRLLVDQRMKWSL